LKYLALDIGEKRIGIAASDESGIIVTPLLTLEVESGLMEKLGAIVAKEKPDVVVVGIPRHQDGAEAEMAAQIREFAEGIHHEYHVTVDFEDESGTSLEAERRLKERGADYIKNKGLIDAEAAAVILEGYLASRS
jgi:putative Holliday junction resolvase